MGIKSTVQLTRDEAIERATDIRMKEIRQEVEDGFRAMTDVELEEHLKRMSDLAADNGESFDDFLIIPAPDKSMRF